MNITNQQTSWYNKAQLEGDVSMKTLRPIRDTMRAFQVLAEITIKRNTGEETLLKALNQAKAAAITSKSKRVVREHNQWLRKHNFKLIDEEV